MPPDNSSRQAQAPEVVGGVPQATDLPGPQPGPEPMTLPEHQAGGSTNWEALFQEERGRRQGLDRRIQEIQQGFESEREKLTRQLTQLQQQLEKRSETPSEPPVSSGNQEAPQQAEGEVLTLLQGMQSDLAQLRAAQHRDSLLREYMGPGKPGEGLDLYAYNDYIPVHPAKVDGEGKADDSAQRQVIEGLIERLRAERGQAAKATEQEMVSGTTTGSSPPPGAPTTQQTGWEEYQRVKAEVNDPDAMAELTPAQRQAKMDHYYKLVGQFGHRDAGFRAPWVSGNDMMKMINNLTAQVAQLSGK